MVATAPIIAKVYVHKKYEMYNFTLLHGIQVKILYQEQG